MGIKYPYLCHAYISGKQLRKHLPNASTKRIRTRVSEELRTTQRRIIPFTRFFSRAPIFCPTDTMHVGDMALTMVARKPSVYAEASLPADADEPKESIALCI